MTGGRGITNGFEITEKGEEEEGLQEQLLDIGHGLLVVEMEGGEAEGVEEEIGRLVVIAKERDASLDANGRFFVESTELSEMVDEDDGTGHHAEHAHAILGGKVLLIVLENVDTHVGQESKSIDEICGVVRLGRGIDETLHHRGRVGEEEGHLVSDFLVHLCLCLLLLRSATLHA